MTPLSLLSVAFVATACATRASTPPPVEAAPAPVPQLASAPASASSSVSAAVPAPPTSPQPSAAHRAERPFPPPDIVPPHPRSAQAGDGHYTALAVGSPFAKTVLHPHASSRFIEVTIVAIDVARVSVHFMPGTEDLGGQKVSFSAGLVPPKDQDRLLAAFNGGFQPRHGRWGMKLGDSTIVPPRDTGCTLALYADGSIRLRTWTALASTVDATHAFRQTPPCLLEEGAVHPDLLAGRDNAWKGKTQGIVTRRRSAVGLDESGSLLFYAVGIEASPRLLAEALRSAGAHNAAELDINWAWTRFFLYGRDAEGKVRVTSSLVEGEYSKSGYVERASERDFFYVLER